MPDQLTLSLRPYQPKVLSSSYTSIFLAVGISSIGSINSVFAINVNTNTQELYKGQHRSLMRREQILDDGSQHLSLSSTNGKLVESKLELAEFDARGTPQVLHVAKAKEFRTENVRRQRHGKKQTSNNEAVDASVRTSKVLYSASSDTGDLLVRAEVALMLAEERIIPTSEICTRLNLDITACRRVGHYIGDSLANATSAIRVKHKLDDDVLFNATEPISNGTGRWRWETGLVRSLTGLKSDDSHGGAIANYSETFADVPQDMGQLHPFIFNTQDGAWAMQFKYPTLVKPAWVHRTPLDNQVLMGFHRDRFMRPVDEAAQADIPYEEKVDKLIWRGSPTGLTTSRCTGTFVNASRGLCVMKYGNSGDTRIDVAFAKSEPGLDLRVAGHMDIASQLRNKFILVIDGNDVASGTEWVLSSNSVPFIASPITRETWLIHSWLEPWKHFIPLESDFSDLPAKVEWAIDHPDQAKHIAEQGKEYMLEFLDPQRERRINAAVLTAYLNRVRIEIVPNEDYVLADMVGSRYNTGCMKH